MKWDIWSFVIKCILQGGDWFDWILDMLEMIAISAGLPYEAHPYIPVIYSIRSTFSVTLAVCMTHVLQTQNYWYISLPSPLKEADFAFVKKMYCAWMTMCMQVCSWMFSLWMCILIYAVWELQRTIMFSETYVVTLFALRHSHILVHLLLISN
jgi:hypothetical protein